MSMIYYANKEGRYVGASNCGVKPEGAFFETEAVPQHAGQILDVKKDVWVTPSGRTSKTQGDLCQGKTKAGKPCKHIANHGRFCRQHVGQA